MNRRTFLTLSGAASLAAATNPLSAAESSSKRDYYELRQFIVDSDQQKERLDKFLKDAFIPAANRLGVKPVGVFYPDKGISPVYMLTRYSSLEQGVGLINELAKDQEYLQKGAEVVNAAASAPAYKRIESSLMLAFAGMPQIDTSIRESGRVFQLRIYESPSVKTNLKKIEMFNDAGEIKLFREVGLNPVFFGQALIGSKLPNLTYMLVFKSMDEQQAAWKRFGSHPEWKRLSKMPEYADKDILSGITNLSLKPAEYSQI